MPIDWPTAMAPNSPPAEVVLLGSFSSTVTPQPPTVTRTDAHAVSGGGEEGAEDFEHFSDKQLQEKITRCRGALSQSTLPDGGEKMRMFVCRLEKELDRRRAAGPKKGDTAQRQAVQPPSGDDPYAFNGGDELNRDNITGKYHLKSYFTPPTKSYVQVEGAACSKELSSFIPGKQACLKKDGQRAKNPMNYQPKNRTVCRNNANYKRLNMDGNITENRRKLGVKSCPKKRQKKNYVDSKGMSNKVLIEDDTFESSTKRWDCSKNQTYDSERLSNSNNKRKEKKEVVFLDDEDTEPAKYVDVEMANKCVDVEMANKCVDVEMDNKYVDVEMANKCVDVEMANKWDESQIYYPSRTDLENDELTYCDIKCLEPEQFLKSPVINFYIQYLKQSRPRDDLYIFNTYFYSKLEEALSRMGEHDSQFSKLRRWWKSVDIFKKPYIILPIHGQMHWSLVIICMPAKEMESGPLMLHLDSLQVHSSQKVFDVIESYLTAEWRHLQNDSSYDIPFSGRVWRHLARKIDKEEVDVPSQQNDYDCGIFMLYYIDRFIQEGPERLTRERLCMFGRKWFDPEEASGLRERIRALLFDLFQSAPLDDGDSQSKSHSDDHPEGEDKDDDTVEIWNVKRTRD